MKLRRILRLAGFLTFVLVAAKTVSAQTAATPQVLLLGTFHFNNPGNDVAKVKVDDILSPKRQAEVQALAANLQAFRPDVIFIEQLPSNQGYIDSLYTAYLAGGARDRRNEIVQVAFRVGKALSLKPSQLVCVDDQSTQFPYDSLMREATSANQAQLLTTLQVDIKRREQEFNQLLSSASITNVLLHMNTPAYQKNDLGFYTNTLVLAGGTTNNVGAYTTAQWYSRNIMIHGNILKRLTGREKRILILFGAGHAAVLNHLMQLNPAYEVVPVASVLKPDKRK